MGANKPDRYRVYRNGQDISKWTGNVTWGDTVQGLGMEFGFTMYRNPYDPYFPKEGAEPGDRVQLVNTATGREVFRGIVVSEELDGVTSRSYTAFDNGFYLNKNEVAIQFNGIAADAAIKKLCEKCGVAVGKLCPMPTKITKIFDGKAVSDAIKEVIETAEGEQGKKYRWEMRGNAIWVEPYADLEVQGYFTPADNVGAFAIGKAAGISGGRSMEEMRNSITVISKENEALQVLATVEDAAAKGRYGRLQKVESIDGKSLSQARSIAKNLLQQLNKVSSNYRVSCLGDDAVRSGRIIRFDFPAVNVGGRFLITACTHSIESGIHKMELELDVM